MSAENQDELIFLVPGVLGTPASQTDVINIAAYLGRNNPEIIARFYESLAQTLQGLSEFPNLGSPQFFSSAQLHNVRQWPIRNFKNYLILYRPFASGNGLEVLRVLHGSRDIQTHLEGAFDEPAAP